MVPRPQWFSFISVCRRLGAALPVVLLLTANLSAAEPDCLERTLPVTVKDKDNKLVEGLRPEDFRGRFQKQPVEILSVEWDLGPRRIVLVLDHSGSMEIAMPLVRGVAVRMIQEAPPEVSLALFVFGKEVESQRGFTESKAELVDTVLGMEPAKGRTALFASLQAAIGLLEPARHGDVVYAITDGVDTWSEGHWRETERRLASSEVRLFVFQLQTRAVPAARGLDSPRRLARVVRSSGGNMLSLIPSRPERLAHDSEVYELEPEQEERVLAGLRSVYEEIEGFYRVRVRLPQAVDKTRKWKLEVVDENGKRRKDLIVVHPQRLFPCEEEGGMRTAP